MPLNVLHYSHYVGQLHAVPSLLPLLPSVQGCLKPHYQKSPTLFLPLSPHWALGPPQAPDHTPFLAVHRDKLNHD